jgi:ribosome-binding protein aMBF1 (putative translation factor)
MQRYYYSLIRSAADPSKTGTQEGGPMRQMPASQSDFRSRVRSERARLGLSQAEAAELAGMRRSVYRQLEYRDCDPRLSTVVRLVGAGFRLRELAPELGRR